MEVLKKQAKMGGGKKVMKKRWFPPQLKKYVMAKKKSIMKKKAWLKKIKKVAKALKHYKKTKDREAY